MIEARLTSFLESNGAPGVAAARIEAGRAFAAAAAGLRQRSGSAPGTADDAWHIGSCAKMITAALFAILVRDGAADWSASPLHYLGDLPSADSGWRQRSIQELSYCTAGMRANPTPREMVGFWNAPETLREQRTLAAARALAKPPKHPGRFVYSNLSYIVIGAIIERITGASFESSIETHIAKPLGLTTLGYGPPDRVFGHGGRFRVGPFILGAGKPRDPANSRSDNPAVFSAAGTMHMNLPDWSRVVGLFMRESPLLDEHQINDLLHPPTQGRMGKGWAPVRGLSGAAFGAQGSNTYWSATVLMNEGRDRASLVVANDGRSRVLNQSLGLAQKILNEPT